MGIQEGVVTDDRSLSYLEQEGIPDLGPEMEDGPFPAFRPETTVQPLAQVVGRDGLHLVQRKPLPAVPAEFLPQAIRGSQDLPDCLSGLPVPVPERLPGIDQRDQDPLEVQDSDQDGQDDDGGFHRPLYISS